ncbi:CSL family zinc fnger-containing protein [Aspergillus melleus]|uniref:CSL family zinc fnger-containing protein n=1 Tax=Aspergillus melleus TaxID=138277 RepID=UPI001E8D0A99|nr:Diphthamide biosynthesis protein 3 [Aspergillus melleus]KAH8428267.1 Diphthamide biosynthesis protein 3 [Aspergillus melleus]
MADDALSIYDEIEIEDMTFDPAIQIYHYPCPCGDRFEIAIDDLRDGEEIAVCPSCSLMIRVIFDPVCSPPVLLVLSCPGLVPLATVSNMLVLDIVRSRPGR